MIKAVIFDRDGVLLDSEFTNVRSTELAFKELGAQLTEDEKRGVVGYHPDDYAPPLLKKYGLSYDVFRPLQSKLYFEVLESTPIFEKAIILLKDIHAKGIMLGLCTSGEREGTFMLLERLGVKNLFQVIVTKEDYSKRKPDPEPYLVTAKKLGVDSRDCLVIEDSEVGLWSALGAGMRCVIIFNNYTNGCDFSGAEQVVGSADQLNLAEIIT